MTVELIQTKLQATCSFLGRLLKELSSWPVLGPRLVDEVECVLSVLLAILLGHLLGARNIGWAAFSGYMVMRSHVRESFRRGLLRVVGTAAGAVAAWLSTSLLGSTIGLAAALGVMGVVSLYLALIGRRSYAWLFMGITYVLVLVDALDDSGVSATAIAWSRFLEVFLGTAACVIVSWLSTWTVRMRMLNPADVVDSTKPSVKSGLNVWHPNAFRHACQGGIALALLPIVWHFRPIEGLSQAGITIMAVMMVPLSSLVSRSNQTSAKLVHRFAGCAIGGILASLILLAGHQSTTLLILGLCAGVVMGRHIENSGSGIAYVGTQFALAFLVVLVPDSYTHPDPNAGLLRLIGILFGMLLLEPVRIVSRLALDDRVRAG